MPGLDSGRHAKSLGPPSVTEIVEDMPTSQPSFARYLYARLGPGSRRQWLGHMFSRAFGASDFTSFWRHWNPFVGYFLGLAHLSLPRRVACHLLALADPFAFSVGVL